MRIYCAVSERLDGVTSDIGCGGDVRNEVEI